MTWMKAQNIRNPELKKFKLSKLVVHLQPLVPLNPDLSFLKTLSI